MTWKRNQRALGQIGFERKDPSLPILAQPLPRRESCQTGQATHVGSARALDDQQSDCPRCRIIGSTRQNPRGNAANVENPGVDAPIAPPPPRVSLFE